MFGYVRISPDKLGAESLERYRACYCGLCHTLGRRYGAAAQLILNYDLVFLAMLLSDAEIPACRTERCLPHLRRGRCCCEETNALDTAADISVILTWWQIRDGVKDHGFFKGLVYRFCLLALCRAYRKARGRQSEFDHLTMRQLDRLTELEKERCAVADEVADAFAVILQGAADTEPDPTRRRVLGQMLYHLGRFIYLVDALDDLQKDEKSGNYNPWLYRFETNRGVLAENDRKMIAQTLDASLRQMAAAFELAEFGCWREIIESVVYEGLYAVGSAVLNGTFRKRVREKENLIRKAGP